MPCDDGGMARLDDLIEGIKQVHPDVLDEQEPEQTHGLGEHDHPLLGQRRDRVLLAACGAAQQIAGGASQG